MPAIYPPRGDTEQAAGHFRAHARRPIRFGVTLRGERTGWERTAMVVDISLAGAGVETDEPLTPGDRVSVAFATPTMWDPLVLTAVVAWAHPTRLTDELDALRRRRSIARAGLAFDYATPDATLAMFEMLATIGFE